MDEPWLQNKKWYGDKPPGKQLKIKDNLHKIYAGDVNSIVEQPSDLDSLFEPHIMENVIEDFKGEYKWLSNFYPVTILYGGQSYPSTEHAYQAQKTDSYLWEECIRNSPTPGKSKINGGKAPIVERWDEIKWFIMFEVLRIKFQDEELKNKLIATYPRYLIEGNVWHDNFWGVCLLDGCKKCKGERGRNILGLMLMLIRDASILEEQSAKTHYSLNEYSSLFGDRVNEIQKFQEKRILAREKAREDCDLTEDRDEE